MKSVGLKSIGQFIDQGEHDGVDLGVLRAPTAAVDSLVVRELAGRFQPKGLKSNRKHFEPMVSYRSHPDEDLKALLFDPQTSGGLFLLVPPDQHQALLAELPHARTIGRAVTAGDHAIVVV